MLSSSHLCWPGDNKNLLCPRIDVTSSIRPLSTPVSLALKVVQVAGLSRKATWKDKQPFTHTYGQCGVLDSPQVHVFGPWEEAGELGENLERTHADTG